MVEINITVMNQQEHYVDIKENFIINMESGRKSSTN